MSLFYYFKNKFLINNLIGYLDGDQKLILTDYDNRRCLKIHSDYEKTTYQTSENDEPSITSTDIQKTDNKTSKAIENSISNISNTNINQNLFKIRTKGKFIIFIVAI